MVTSTTRRLRGVDKQNTPQYPNQMAGETQPIG